MTPNQIGYYARVSLAFARLTDNPLVAFSRNVVTLMTGNASYVTPMPTLAIVTTATDLLEDSTQAAMGGGRLLIATRNANREALLNLLRTLAAYVMASCQSDVLILLSSGFDAVKTPSPVGVLDAPENLSLGYTGTSGEFQLRFKAVKNANNYSLESALVPEGPYVSQGISSSSRSVISGFTPGVSAWVRVCANGTQGPSGWSVPTTAMAI